MRQIKEILRISRLRMNCTQAEYGERIKTAAKLYRSLEDDFSTLSEESQKRYRNLKDQCHDEINSMTEAYYEW